MIAMWQSKVAPSQLTGAISLLIPIKDIRCYLRICLAPTPACIRLPAAFEEKREKVSSLPCCPSLENLFWWKQWMILRTPVSPEQKESG